MIRTQPWSPNSLPGRMSRPRRRRLSASATSSTPTSARTKFASDGNVSRPRRASPSASTVAGREFSRRRSSTSSGLLQARAAGCERRPVHVEGLLHDVEVGRQRLVRERVPEAKPGQSEDLREGAQEEDRAGRPRRPVPGGAAARARRTPRTPRRRRRRSGPGAVEEALPLAPVGERPRRVVRVAEPDQPGVVRAAAATASMSWRWSRAGTLDDLCAGRRADLRVEPVRRHRDDDRVPRLEERVRDADDERLDPVSRHDARGPRADSGGKRSLKSLYACSGYFQAFSSSAATASRTPGNGPRSPSFQFSLAISSSP